MTKFTKHQLKAVVRGTISMPLEGWIRLAHLANATGCVDWQRYRDRKVGHDPATDEVICRVTGQRVADMVKEKITVGVPGLPDLTKAVIAEAGSETSPLPVGQEPKTPDFDNVEE